MEDKMQLLISKLPKWKLFKKNHPQYGNLVFAFRDCYGRQKNQIAVRVDMEGVFVFTKKNSHNEFLSLKDFKGSKGDLGIPVRISPMNATTSFQFQDLFSKIFSENEQIEIKRAASYIHAYHYKVMDLDLFKVF